jgi:tetratricopeptide (TPR) repeat protein
MVHYFIKKISKLFLYRPFLFRFRIQYPVFYARSSEKGMKSLKTYSFALTLCTLSIQLSASNELSHPQQIYLNDYKQAPSALIKTAEELINWKMYPLAIPAYTHAIQSLQPLNNSIKTNLTLRIAQTYLLLGQPEKALETLEATSFVHDQTHEIKLKALILIHLNKPKEVISLLETSNTSHAILLAMAHEINGSYDLATNHLRSISTEKNPPHFASLLLAKIAITKGAYQLAYNELQSLKKHMQPNHPLYPEALWMMGVSQYQLDNIPQSIICYEEALTLPMVQAQSWYTACIEQLSHAYLTECNNSNRSTDEIQRLLSRAEQLIKTEFSRHSNDDLKIALAKVYLTKNSFFPSEETLEDCRTLLDKSQLFSTEATQTEALLLRAQMASSYIQREEHLRTLTSSTYNTKNMGIPYGWLLRGHNEREEAYNDSNQERHRHLELAIGYYQKAYALFKKFSPHLAIESLRNWAQVATDLREPEQLKKVYTIASNHIKSQPPQAETYYLNSLMATHLYDLNGNASYLQEALESLQKGLKASPTDKEKIQLSLLLSKVFFLKNSFHEAERTLASLPESLPNTPMAAEALYWGGRASSRNPNPLNPPQFYYQKCYTDYPSSSFAAEAFFRMYTYQDFLHGEKDAKKHLEEMIVLYPDSQYVLDALFLLGLDSKRDRKTIKGKWISKSNTTKAIDQFQEISTQHQRLQAQGLIEKPYARHYSALELRATLEKALCNLAIARQSSGAKKHIYLQYAEEVFTNLINRMSYAAQNTLQQDTHEEALYGLAQTHLEAKHYDEAEAMIHQIILSYQSSKVTRGYYLSRCWHDLSIIAMANISDEESQHIQKKTTQALEHLQHAEECAKGRILSTDQTIDLWLKMSHCHKLMKQYDQAMRYLTKAIDEDAVSSLRLKAMYLRAEIYELQGRHELSRRQLEATSNKGGLWGQKAKDKLGEIYGYH